MTRKVPIGSSEGLLIFFCDPDLIFKSTSLSDELNRLFKILPYIELVVTRMGTSISVVERNHQLVHIRSQKSNGERSQGILAKQEKSGGKTPFFKGLEFCCEY